LFTIVENILPAFATTPTCEYGQRQYRPGRNSRERLHNKNEVDNIYLVKLTGSSKS